MPNMNTFLLNGVLKIHHLILNKYLIFGILYLIMYAIFVCYYPYTSQSIDSMYLASLLAYKWYYVVWYGVINILHILLYVKLIKAFQKNYVGKILNTAFSLNYCVSVYILLLTYIKVI